MTKRTLRICIGVVLSLLLLVTSIPVNGFGGVMNVKAEEGDGDTITPSEKVYVYYKQIENSDYYSYRLVGESSKSQMTDWTPANVDGNESWRGFASADDESAEDELFPLYELYNSYNPQYYYTTNMNDKDALVGGGWTYNGIVTYVYSEGSEAGNNLYSVYNPNSGEHVLTPYITTRDKFFDAGWMYEGVRFKVYSVLDNEPDTFPIVEIETPAPSTNIYMYYKRNNIAGDCSYRLVGENKIEIVQNRKYDGNWSFWNAGNSNGVPSWKGSAEEGDGLKPLYELYQPWTGDCVYTINEEEKKTKVESGNWMCVGIITYVYPAGTDKGKEVWALINKNENAHCYTPYTATKEALLEKGWTVENGGDAVWKAVEVYDEDPNAIPGALDTKILPSDNIYVYYKQADNGYYIYRFVGDSTKEDMTGWIAGNSASKMSFVGSKEKTDNLQPLYEILDYSQ